MILSFVRVVSVKVDIIMGKRRWDYSWNNLPDMLLIWSNLSNFNQMFKGSSSKTAHAPVRRMGYTARGKRGSFWKLVVAELILIHEQRNNYQGPKINKLLSCSYPKLKWYWKEWIIHYWSPIRHHHHRVLSIRVRTIIVNINPIDSIKELFFRGKISMIKTKGSTMWGSLSGRSFNWIWVVPKEEQ